MWDMVDRPWTFSSKRKGLTMRRNYLFWGIVFVVFSGTFLLKGFNLLPGNILGYFWQVFLIILGSWILFNSIWKPVLDLNEMFSVNMQGAKTARLRINHGAGKLSIGSGVKNGEFLFCKSSGRIQHKSVLKGETLEISLSPSADILPFLGFAEGFNWNINLSGDIPLRLDLETGASHTIADLSDLNIIDLNISTGASRTALILPAIPDKSRVTINAGVASLDLQIPKEIGAQISLKNEMTTLKIDDDRFFRSMDKKYQTKNFEQSSKRSEIIIEAGVGTIFIH
jgi:hypothetical protein